jgi:hypothetical protein
MGRHSIDRHPGYKRHMRKRRLMFYAYDILYVSIGFFIGVLVTSSIVILLEGGLNA